MAETATATIRPKSWLEILSSRESIPRKRVSNACSRGSNRRSTLVSSATILPSRLVTASRRPFMVRHTNLTVVREMRHQERRRRRNRPTRSAQLADPRRDGDGARSWMLAGSGHFNQHARILRSNQQKRSRGPRWGPTALFPFLERSDRDSEQRREFLLRQPGLFADGRDRGHIRDATVPWPRRHHAMP